MKPFATHHFSVFLLFSTLIFLTLTTQAQTIISVTNTDDSGPGTLRQALTDIGLSSDPGPFTVTFGLTGVINLTSGLVAPNKDVVIVGPSSTTTAITLNGGGPSSDFSILIIPSSATLEIQYLAFTNGHTTNGGAISLDGGTLRLTYCYLYGNSATSFGGAMYQGGGSFTITNSTVASNTAISNSGGLHKGGTDPGLIDNCTFSGNVGRAGGAIEASAGSLTISNSTFTQNQAVGDAGAPANGSGGAIYGSNSIPITINNCLIVGNTSLGNGPDLIDAFNSTVGHNLIGDTNDATIGGTTTGNITGESAAAVLLPTLALNSGTTPTHAILTSGPAYNAGPSASTDADQRGLAVFGSRRDIGAFESQVAAVTATVGSVSGLCGGSAGGFSLTVAGGTGSGYQYRLTDAGSFSTLSGSSPYSITVSFSGNYTVTLQDSDGILSNAVAVPIGFCCQPVLHVTESGSGVQDGSSWANSLPGTALQTAIDRAALCGGGEVWVARGLYKPTSTTGFASRSVSFSMANNVRIYGGFAGLITETTLGSRPTLNPIAGQPSNTTLSGDIGTVGVTSDNSFHILYNPASLSLTNSAVLDGFVLANGNANFGGFNGRGAGMYNDGSGSTCNPTIRNCSFIANNTPNAEGAGMYNVANNGSCSPTLINCVFAQNEGNLHGCGMANLAEGTGVCSPTLTNCQFNQNTAGAISNQSTAGSTCSPVLTHCTFRLNFSSNGGIIYNFTNGGTCSPTVTNCQFIENRAIAQGVFHSTTDFRLTGQSHPVLTNCVFQSNTVGAGGGSVLNTWGAVTDLINSSFGGNRTTSTADGRVVSTSEPMSMTNCAFWDNVANPFSGPISAHYSLFPVGSTTAITTTNCLTVSVSPFASTMGTELAACSPAINAGDPATTSATAGTTDVVGNARFFNGGRVDIGADEFAGEGLPVSFSVLGSGTATCASSPTVTLTGSETGVTYELQRDGTAVGSPVPGTGAALSFGPQSLSGVYTVLATRTVSSCTALMAQLATVVSDAALPTVSLAPTSATLTCTATSLTLTATATGSSLSYVYAGPSGTLAGTGNTRPVSVSGLYSVTVTGANGCTASASTTVFSNTITPTAGLVASGTITCAEPTATLTASGASGVPGGTYSFSGPGIISTAGNVATVNVDGTYSVTVLNAANGCFATNTVSVSSDLGGASAAPTLSASSSVVCAEANVMVVATGGSSPMQWYHNGAMVAGQTSATLSLGGVQAAQAGSYVLVATGGCSVTSAPFGLTVNPLPTVALIVPSNATVQGATITLPSPLTGVNFQVLGGVSFERLIVLDRINGFEIRQVDSNASGIFSITRPGPFQLTVTGAKGCKRTVEGLIVGQP